MTVVSILLPTSHRLQPLYLKFEGSLYAAFNGESDLYLKLCGHEKIIQYELTEFFNKAIVKVTKIKKRNKIYGFRAADICLLNPDMLTDIESEVNCGDK